MDFTSKYKPTDFKSWRLQGSKCRPVVLLMVNVWFSRANVLAMRHRKTERNQESALYRSVSSENLSINYQPQEVTCQVGRQQDQSFTCQLSRRNPSTQQHTHTDHLKMKKRFSFLLCTFPDKRLKPSFREEYNKSTTLKVMVREKGKVRHITHRPEEHIK